MGKTCKQCQGSFEITRIEQKFYEKIEVPSPTFCPQCRERRRLTFRNERSLYKKNCDLCSKPILSVYDPQKPFKAYCNACYFGDQWNAQDYALNFDFQKPFFAQFKQLYDAVPKLNLYVKSCENCDYTNLVVHNKNGYLLFGSGYTQDCLYSTHIFYCEHCVDCFFSEKCTGCYQLIDCKNCYQTRFSTQAQSCQDSWFLYDCRNCKNCIGCWNLRNKEYYIFNKPVSKEQYEKFLEKELPPLLEDSHKTNDLLNKISDNAIHKFRTSENSENVSGDFIYNSKNAFNSFNIYECEDVHHLVFCLKQKDSGDAIGTSIGELAYDCLNNDFAHKTRWCMNSTYLNNCDYCDSCDNSKNLFGCVGLKHKEYCILNKQYTKQEYETLVPRIMGHMEKTGEWGEYFPMSLSPFLYNETVAYEYYPEGEEKEKSVKKISEEPPDKSLTCINCKKHYKIIEQELKFYRQHNLPLPKECPQCRHKKRLESRNPRKLWDRNCLKCGKDIQTSYSPETPKKVVCEKCYLEEVH